MNVVFCIIKIHGAPAWAAGKIYEAIDRNATSSITLYALCLMLYALRPTPYALRLTPYALRLTS